MSIDYKPYRYDKGYCFYRVDIRTSPDDEAGLSDKYCVIRNNFYRVSVTAVRNLGAPTPTGVVPADPDTPIEDDCNILAEITVMDWIPVDRNATLE